MPRVLGCEPFADEHMPEVSATRSAHDLGSSTIGIRDAPNGAWDLVIEAGPSASRRELVFALVQRCFALAAGIGTGHIVIVELSRVRRLSPLVKDDSGFFWREFVPLVVGHDGLRFCDQKPRVGSGLLSAFLALIVSRIGPESAPEFDAKTVPELALNQPMFQPLVLP